MSDPPTVPRRTLVGTAFDVSALGFDLDARGLGPPSSDERTAALLRRARSLGISTFRIPTGAGSLRVERLLAASFPKRDPRIVTIEARSFSELATETAHEGGRSLDPDFEARVRSSLAGSGARLVGSGHRILEWRGEPTEDRPSSGVDAVLDGLRSDGVVEAIARPLPDPSDPAEGPSNGTAPSIWTGSLSLLETESLPQLRDRASRRPLGFLNLDPFAGGRLDGSRFGATVRERRPDAPPPTVRELHREFDPVLRLGFLTRSRQRTLAQASLQFLYHWPWVTTVLVPVPSAERLLELVEASIRPPLTDAEVEQIVGAA